MHGKGSAGPCGQADFPVGEAGKLRLHVVENKHAVVNHVHRAVGFHANDQICEIESGEQVGLGHFRGGYCCASEL